ncbi:uncharacterized protein LOC127876130 [Dreissena polymorpha]|uniref:uncharacterized protein LOC127876130 n=1 Tax=Dreissena polymorpha TaxID=45954 RepID=UPI002263D945|nr:uncharacterized protein LOC127876130 [Dreissena polymorpha]
MEVSFSLTLWTEEGNTELCYLLGDRCYVPDGCIYVNATALATGIHCPLYPGPYNRHFGQEFNPFPFILRGKYTVHMSLREEGNQLDVWNSPSVSTTVTTMPTKMVNINKH